MPELVSVYNVCTAKHLNGMDVPLIGTSSYVSYIRQLISLPALTDFAMVYAVTTATQYNNAKPVLELIGFEEVFTGKKTFYNVQRYKETGALTMWCCSTDKWPTKNERLKSLIEINHASIIRTEDMSKYPLFTMRDFNQRFNRLFNLDSSISGKPFSITFAAYYKLVEDIWGINPGLNPNIDTFRQYKDIQNDLVKKARGD